MRNAFAKYLTEFAAINPKIVLLYGDIGNKLFDEFKVRYPGRYFNCGVAEANMVGVAAGLAKKGFMPFVYTINSFLYLKAIEQIKLDVCYSQLPVTFVGTGAGLNYSSLGATHHSLDDVAILRAIPNLAILTPTGPLELMHMMSQTLETSAPTYIRLGKKGESDLKAYRESQSQDMGPLWIRKTEQAQVLVLSFGVVASLVEEAVAEFDPNSHAIDYCVMNQLANTPLLSHVKSLCKYRNILVIEEHGPFGGLTSILNDTFADNSSKPQVTSINTLHRFHIGLGELEHARQSLNLSKEKIKYALSSINR